MDAVSFDSPLELKSADDAGDNELVTKALDKALEGFNSTVAEKLAAVEKKSGDRLDSLEAAIKRINIGGRVTSDAAPERKSFGSYLRRGIEGMGADEVKNMTVSGNSAIAPTQIGDELIKLLTVYSPLRKYAKVVTISAPAITYPKRTGSTSAVWVGETAARTSTDMTFGSLTITPFELAAYTDVSNWLLEDNAYNLEGELMDDFAEQFGKAEGAAFINGNGTTQPAGIMADASITNVIKTGVAADFPATDAATADKILDLFYAIPGVFANEGVWMMNRTTIGKVRKLKLTTGEYLLSKPFSEGAPTTIQGRPVIEMPDMDSAGANKYPIIFGDPRGYRITDRISFDVVRNPYIVQAAGQVRFHARKRVGAAVTNPDRFVKLQCAV